MPLCLLSLTVMAFLLLMGGEATFHEFTPTSVPVIVTLAQTTASNLHRQKMCTCSVAKKECCNDHALVTIYVFPNFVSSSVHVLWS